MKLPYNNNNNNNNNNKKDRKERLKGHSPKHNTLEYTRESIIPGNFGFAITLQTERKRAYV